MNISIHDPLYGINHLTDFEYKLILSPEVQRLRYVRLSNINSLLITGASEINRFEHAIGVLILMKEWLKIHKVTQMEEKCLKAAAIFHDINTSPFGHSIQYIYNDNDFDKKFSHQDLKSANADNHYQENRHLQTFNGAEYQMKVLFNNQEQDLIMEIINGGGKYGKLISANIDLDNIDNVIRLAYHVGISNKKDVAIAIKLTQGLNVFNNKLAVFSKDIPLIKKWQDLRKKLYELLLYDWADFSAKAMLTYAVECSVESGSIGVNNWRETDNDLLYLLKNATGKDQHISRIINRLILGDLYNPLLILSSTSVEEYNTISKISFKRKFELFVKGLGLNSPCIFHPIIDSKKTERAIDIYISDQEKDQIIGKDSNQLLIGIFVSKKVNDNLEKDIINQIINYLGSINIQNIEILPNFSDLGENPTSEDKQLELF